MARDETQVKTPFPRPSEFRQLRTSHPRAPEGDTQEQQPDEQESDSSEKQGYMVNMLDVGVPNSIIAVD